MTHAEPLFDEREPLAPWQQHSATSQDAAVAVRPALRGLRGLVYALIAEAPDGLTDDELEVALGRPGSSVRPRRVELAARGHVVAHGERATRTGNLATVWVAPATPVQ